MNKATFARGNYRRSSVNDFRDDDEDAALQAALALSRASGEDVDMHDSAAKAGDARTGEGASAAEGGESMDEDLDEEEAIARAIQMSMQPQEEQKK